MPSLVACAQMSPTIALEVGASAVSFTEISPVFDAENLCSALPPTASVPVKGVDRVLRRIGDAAATGVIRPATASTAAAGTRIPASYRG